MKHPYKADCGCARCTKERARRTQQSSDDYAKFGSIGYSSRDRCLTRRSRRDWENRRPVWGSQEWAETRGDDIDSPSGDY